MQVQTNVNLGIYGWPHVYDKKLIIAYPGAFIRKYIWLHLYGDNESTLEN